MTSDLNREFWDERVPIHTASDFYDVEGFKGGREPLQSFELEDLGDVSGRSLVHLQCHFGLDTLSLARHGARVTGLDFSGSAIKAARKLAAEIGVEADFVCADVYEAPEALVSYFDWEAWTRDLAMDYTTIEAEDSSVYVFRCL